MAIVLKDRVKQSASAPGTGTITLGSTPTGFQAFSAIGNGNVTYFAIVDSASGAWEVNYGTYTSSGTTLTRNATPLSSSAAGALVNFTGTVDVFCTYPSEKAIYEETTGNVLIDGGPITVVGNNVTTYTTFSAALGELYGNINSFAQFYAQNLNSGSSASTDIVAYNDLGDGATNFIDMGISSSNYTDATYPIFTPGSGYVYNDGGELIIGSATDDVLLFAGGVATTDWAARIDKTTKSLTTKADLNVGGALDVTGAAVFGSTVLLDANPTTALQAATKQYVDNQVTAGLHIHEPVRVETTGNLTATYVQGGTTFNITDITSTTTVTTSASHGLSVNDQIWLYSTAGNGLSTNTAYFVYSVPAANQLTLSLTFGGAQITGLTNASGLTYATRANSGVGATLTNAGAQAALQVDGVNLSTTNRVMVRLQTNGFENGVYTVTTVGDGSTNWVLTRATDSNQVNPANPNGVGTGDYYFTQEGTLNAGDSHVLTTEPNTMIIGYTTLTFTQFSGSVDYTGGTNITVAGQTISVSGTIAATLGGTGTSTVATGDLLYGSGTNTWGKLAAGAGYKSLVMNAGGTNVEWNAVALNQSGAVSGNLPATNGGTGLNSYTLGDTVYSSAANTLSALAGNTTTTKKFLTQTGTGSASAAPAWGTISGSDVSGNISGSAGSVANALTLGTYLTGTSFNGSSAVTATVDATSANTASKVVARDASGNFSAGTITATLSGAATSATTATNLAGGTANQIPYQASAGTTSFATAPSATGQFLGWNGSAFAWSVPSGSAATPTALGTVYGSMNSATPWLTALGYQAGNVSTGTNNVFVGYKAGLVNSTGTINTALGAYALYTNTTGESNTAVGVNALALNVSSSFNTAVGLSALQNTTAANNTALGHYAGLTVSTGQNNILIGKSAGVSGANNLTTGSNNILIGYQAEASAATVSNEATWGNSSITSNRFWGDFKMGGSSAGSSGQVLTSQGAGTAPIWAAASASLSRTNTYLSTNQSLSGGAYTLLCGTSLTAGNWFVIGTVTYDAYSNINMGASIWDGNYYSGSAQNIGGGNSGTRQYITVGCIVSLNASTAVYIRVYTSNGGVTAYASTNSNTGTMSYATQLTAFKIS